MADEEESPEIIGWMAYTANRKTVIKAKSFEDAARQFQERFGYYPEAHLLDPILKGDI